MFKVGDKVIPDPDAAYGKWTAGKTYEVVEGGPRTGMVQDDENAFWCANMGRVSFVAAPAAPAEQRPQFKVGDKVIPDPDAAYGKWTAGKTYEVVDGVVEDDENTLCCPNTGLVSFVAAPRPADETRDKVLEWARGRIAATGHPSPPMLELLAVLGTRAVVTTTHVVTLEDIAS